MTVQQRDYLDLVACGPWLEFSMAKRLGLTLRWWLPMWGRALWCVLRYRLRYGRDMCFREAITTVLASAQYLHHHWLWWEPRFQLAAKQPNYPVDWAGKGSGWYPFW